MPSAMVCFKSATSVSKLVTLVLASDKFVCSAAISSGVISVSSEVSVNELVVCALAVSLTSRLVADSLIESISQGRTTLSASSIENLSIINSLNFPKIPAVVLSLHVLSEKVTSDNSISVKPDSSALKANVLSPGTAGAAAPKKPTCLMYFLPGTGFDVESGSYIDRLIFLYNP